MSTVIWNKSRFQCCQHCKVTRLSSTNISAGWNFSSVHMYIIVFMSKISHLFFISTTFIVYSKGPKLTKIYIYKCVRFYEPAEWTFAVEWIIGFWHNATNYLFETYLRRIWYFIIFCVTFQLNLLCHCKV